ncbi:MAG: hypothetical protein JRN10_00265 [Nitrososphaerota archaeon]|jgi:hypothetical protein|nr:hypothetical protein [Nitrososphaerota archaeon]MDG6929671.1 hypothetical protein [Nitrososphaerota archaeon]
MNPQNIDFNDLIIRSTPFKLLSINGFLVVRLPEHSFDNIPQNPDWSTQELAAMAGQTMHEFIMLVIASKSFILHLSSETNYNEMELLAEATRVGKIYGAKDAELILTPDMDMGLRVRISLKNLAGWWVMNRILRVPDQ